jgi:hypothetical protein
MRSAISDFLEHPWPEDIPDGCPKCGATLNAKINLSFGHGKIGRAFQWLAWWGTLPWAVFLIVFGAFGAASRWGGFIIGIGLVIPWVVFSVLTVLSPSSRRVRCFPCKYSKDYPAMPEEDKAEQVEASDS